MLTTVENELLCRVEGDAPMGRLMRRHWVPALLSEQVSNRTVRRCGFSFSARSSSRSATATERSACSASPVRTARRRSRSDATKSAGCAASITAGSSTPTVTSSTCLRSRKQARFPKRQSIFHTRHARPADSYGPIWDRRKRCRNSRRHPGRLIPRPGFRSRRSRCPATGRRSWKGRSTPRILRRCIHPTCGPPRVTPRQRAITGFVLRPTRTRAFRSN